MGRAELMRLSSETGVALVGWLEPTADFEAIREVCEGPSRIVRDAVASSEYVDEPLGPEVDVALERGYAAIRALRLQLLDAADEVIPGGDVIIEAMVGVDRAARRRSITVAAQLG